MRELLLGGQKSGKSAAAEERVRAWLAASTQHRAVLVATGLGHDAELRERIARHQADRAVRVPQLQCIEEPREIAAVLAQHGDANTLIVVDCMTMWLTNWLMPFDENGKNGPNMPFSAVNTAKFAINNVVNAVQQHRSDLILVSNEIGLGVIPLGREVRHFVDELGKLNQALARACERVTLLTAGCQLRMKG